MKPRTAKRSEQGMRFFTPELYMRFNSSDEDMATEADEAWENALVEYRKHLDGLRDQMPAQVTKLAGFCLHDAELLGQVMEPVFPFPMEFLSVRQGGEIVSLIYLLGDRVEKRPAAPEWSFSKLRVHWLYDEIDVVPGQDQRFVHRILLSDGQLLIIPFISVHMHVVSLSPGSEKELSRQSA